MSDVSATQREVIAATLRREMWAVKVAGLNEAEGLHLADAVLVLVEAWLAGAVQAERERIEAAVETLRWPKPDEPNSRIHDDQSGWRAWRSHEKAIDAVLAVVSRDTRSSSDE